MSMCLSHLHFFPSDLKHSTNDRFFFFFFFFLWDFSIFSHSFVVVVVLLLLLNSFVLHHLVEMVFQCIG